MLVTMGKHGSLFLGKDGSLTTCAALPVEAELVVDTTGAGDCYRGAFGRAFVEGKSILDCMRFGTAAASLAIQTKGAMNSMPHRELVQQGELTFLTLIIC